MPAQPATRRTVLRGTALAGVAGLGAAACSGGSGEKKSALPTGPVELGAADAVPVGGAKLYREDKLVVSQPAKGEFKAFSAVCTHAGCVVDTVRGTEVSCPCHHSRFDTTTGKVLHGPATDPLPAVPVKTAGGKLVAGPDA
ncbi:Rieske (2Fe-2S) protein [Streptomyces sp. H27-D2]|uniref:Rieske (2Fe-2S) protein n=1 Tax=Streptomyces sp. H27-D2 TaxID=3046304 RepID=UPI002DBE90B2|nr:Rieske (2Fe-2S) protein [Streptomyces sp. H27-D2]MEC4019472.1 Rieske (2Fe-2S) protein [Streptomyces sp. H27-D2]